MQILRVEIVRAVHRELRYKVEPDVEAQLIFLWNPHQQEMAHSINIGGARLLIGIDDEHFINNVEIIKPRRQVTTSNAPKLPLQLDELGIKFDEVREKHSDLEMQVKVAMTEDLTNAVITIGEEREGHWTRLSIDTWVKVSDAVLGGFFVKLK